MKTDGDIFREAWQALKRGDPAERDRLLIVLKKMQAQKYRAPAEKVSSIRNMGILMEQSDGSYRVN